MAQSLTLALRSRRQLGVIDRIEGTHQTRTRQQFRRRETGALLADAPGVSLASGRPDGSAASSETAPVGSKSIQP